MLLMMLWGFIIWFSWWFSKLLCYQIIVSKSISFASTLLGFRFWHLQWYQCDEWQWVYSALHWLLHFQNTLIGCDITWTPIGINSRDSEVCVCVFVLCNLNQMLPKVNVSAWVQISIVQQTYLKVRQNVAGNFVKPMRCLAKVAQTLGAWGQVSYVLFRSAIFVLLKHGLKFTIINPKLYASWFYDPFSPNFDFVYIF